MSDWFTVLALAGLTGIITRSYLLQSVRDSIKQPKLKYLINCPQCTGFWVGVFFGLVDGCRRGDSVLSILVYTGLWAGAVSLFSSATVTSLDYLSFAKTRLLNDIANDAASLITPTSDQEVDQEADEEVGE